MTVSESRVTDPERLRVLAATGLLDGPSVEVLDRLTGLATRVIGAPVALVSLVDAGRQFFVSAVGLPEPWAGRRQTPLSHSFCQHVVRTGAPLVVSDARADELLCTNLAIPDIGVIAYAGFPLHSPDGYALGSFCVIDTRPRVWTPAELAIVEDLAAAAESELAVRLSHARVVRETQQTAAILAAATDAFVSANVDGTVRIWNAAAERLFGWTASEAMGRPLTDLIIPERFRAAHDAGMQRVRESGRSTLAGQRLELAALDREGREFPVEMVLQAQTIDDGMAFHAFLHDISERHRVRAELDRERTFLASLLDSLESGVAACDAEGRLVLVNRALREQDVLADGLRSDTWAEQYGLYGADGVTPLAASDVPLARAFHGETVHRADLVVRRPGRPPRQYRANAQPIRAADGRRLGAVVALHDVTAAVRTGLLRDVQHAVATSLVDARTIADAATRTVGAVAGGLGWVRGEYWQLSDDEQTLTRIGSWTAQGKKLAEPETCGFADQVRATAKPLQAADPVPTLGLPVRSGDRVLGVLVFLHDGPMDVDADLLSRLDGISAHVGRFVERRRAEAARQAFERVVSAIDDYVWTVEVTRDGGARLIYASPNGAAVFGADLRTPDGETVQLTDLVHREDAAALEAFQAGVREGRASELEARFVGADGVVRWIWTRSVPRQEDGRLFIDGICTDVTERHRISAEREALLEREQQQVRELRELDRMKDELVALVTHELRSPITSIRGYLELVLDEAEACTPQAGDFLRIIERKAADLQQLTDDLLDLARLDAGEISVDPRPVSLTRLLNEVATDHRPAAEAKHLTVDVATDGPVVVPVDPTRFRQVLTNVLSNAVKYTPEGGRVTVRAVRADDIVTVSVADTGIGIPADQYARLFERFFRTSNAVQQGIKGTGLGLAITRAIVERHGGTITARPGTPTGTVFTITLPAATP
ncbi:ATP-binding protein [Cryptosporangium aurantiacum]|uniref:Sensor-like histidine kinase SenX3 n=1 Tax=Cryptosporangium aurantiacum TaxID=134849 RepID=A0A1M7MIX2_9ACTN|nr:ATP-binding protein [Cryptosporangium aurantiacum]SHM90857.1 PAS domain S-box-containing protein [Cryptosporangium aurantiacum]